MRRVLLSTYTLLATLTGCGPAPRPGEAPKETTGEMAPAGTADTGIMAPADTGMMHSDTAMARDTSRALPPTPIRDPRKVRRDST